MKKDLARLMEFALVYGLALCALPTNVIAVELTAEDYYHRGMKENSSGDFAAAIADYDKAIQINPQYWNAFGNRSAARFNAKNYQGALQDVDICLAHVHLKTLEDLKKQIQAAIASNSAEATDLEERKRIARQMLLNAQLGTNFNSPAYMIMMQAQRIQQARALSGRAAGNGQVAAVPDSSQANLTGSLNQKLQLMAGSQAVHNSQNSQTVPNAQVAQSAQNGHSLQSTPGSQQANAVGTTALESKLGLLASAGNSAENKPAMSTLTAQNYFDRACGKGHQMDLAGAIKDYDQAIKLNPRYGEAYANRGSARFNTGDRKGALEDLNMAVELMPNNQGLKALRDQVARSQ